MAKKYKLVPAKIQTEKFPPCCMGCRCIIEQMKVISVCMTCVQKNSHSAISLIAVEREKSSIFTKIKEFFKKWKKKIKNSILS